VHEIQHPDCCKGAEYVALVCQGESALIVANHRASTVGTGERSHSALIWSESFSAAMSTGIWVTPEGTLGKIEASTTRRPCTPCTRPFESTTEPRSSARPMRQVPHQWCAACPF